MSLTIEEYSDFKLINKKLYSLFLFTLSKLELYLTHTIEELTSRIGFGDSQRFLDIL